MYMENQTHSNGRCQYLPQSVVSFLWSLFIGCIFLVLVRIRESNDKFADGEILEYFDFYTAVDYFKHIIIALWVKQCNYKDCKVVKSKTLVRLHFSSEIIQTFFKWCQTAKSLWLILGLIIYTKYLRSYLQKTWRGGLISLKFCVLAN